MSIPTFPSLLGLAFPVKKSPTFVQRLRHTSVSGKSTTQATQPFARYAYDLPFRFLRTNVGAELATLQGFYEFCLTTPSPFHFADPDDGSVTAQGLGTGDGATTDFAFVRALGSSIGLVQDVLTSGLVVKVAGVAKTIGVDFSLLTTAQYGTNYAVRFAAAPANGALLTADFSYTWLCEFDEDSLELAKNYSTIWEAGSVKFTSVLQ